MTDYKTIEKRAKAYARKVWYGGRDYAALKKYPEQDFIAGAKYAYEELKCWRDPKLELPEKGKSVLAKTQYNKNCMYPVLRHNGEHWYSIETPYNYDDDIVYWQPIWEEEY